jgi:proline iminopeptidase
MAASFPSVEPYDQGMLDVGDGNLVYWETCGNPAGTPVVMLHGGPGQGCSAKMRQNFDPVRYRAVLFDQRGCGRSRPHVSDPAVDLRHNTTAHLVADLERLRVHLGIERWLLFGASWGTTLAVVYAARYPQRVSGVVLTAITATRRREIDWLYHGVGRFFPEAWENFRAGVPAADRDGNLVAAYARLMEAGDQATLNAAAVNWCIWESTVLSLEPGAKPEDFGGEPTPDMVSFARLTAHYYANAGWLPDNAVIEAASTLGGIPCLLTHGRLDLSCPVETAFELAQAWPGARLLIDDQSGHRVNQTKRTWMHAALDEFAAR